MILLELNARGLLGQLSFVPPTVAFLGATVYVFGERNPLYLLAYAVGFTLLVWGVFISWLKVPL